MGPSSQHWLQKWFVFINQDLRCFPIVPLRLNCESNIFVNLFLFVNKRGMQLLYFFPFLEVNQHFRFEPENQKVEHNTFKYWQLLSIEEWLWLNAVEVIAFRLWTLNCSIVRRATETDAWLCFVGLYIIEFLPILFYLRGFTLLIWLSRLILRWLKFYCQMFFCLASPLH